MSLKLKSQIALSINAIIIILLGAFIFTSINNLDNLSNMKSQKYNEILEIEAIKQINFTINQTIMDIVTKKFTQNSHAKNIKKIDVLFTKLREKEKNLIIIANNNQERHLVLRLLNSFRKFELIIKSDLIPLANNNLNNKSLLTVYNQVKNMSKTIKIDSEDIKDSISEILETSSQTKRVYIYDIKEIIVISLLALILFSILSSMFVIRASSNSLKKFQSDLLDFFKFLNSETDNVNLLYESKDEIGKLAIILNKYIRNTKLNIKEDKKFIDETINILSEFEKGDLTQRVNLPVKNPMLILLKQKLDDLY